MNKTHLMHAFYGAGQFGYVESCEMLFENFHFNQQRHQITT